MKRLNIIKFFALVTLFFSGLELHAWSNLINSRNPSEIEQGLHRTEDRAPVPYPNIDGSDILWSKPIWEIIDLAQPSNYHLYYPTDVTNTDNNKASLFYVLVEGIKSGKIKNVYADSYFKFPKTWNDVQESITKVDTLDLGIEQMNAGLPISPEYIDKRTIAPADILQYRVRGIWYFDRLQSKMMWRVLGIAPVAKDVYFIDSEKGGDDSLVELFWVFYPSDDLRQVLFESKIFNEKNGSKDISFDDIFTNHQYNSIIYKYYNVYQDREISTYTGNDAARAIQESERIQQEIRDFEEMMWVYY